MFTYLANCFAFICDAEVSPTALERFATPQKAVSTSPVLHVAGMHVHRLAQVWNAIIGASLSEPHIDEFAVEFLSLYIYICISRTSCRKSHPALILRVLASFVNSKTIHKLLTLTYLSEKTPNV